MTGRRRKNGPGLPGVETDGPVATVAQVGPVRTCIGCRRKAHPDAMVRLVASDEPPGFVVDRLAPGRGAWLCRAEESPGDDRGSDDAVAVDGSCLGAAIKRRAFARAFRR